jgi:1-acyl-sn-glycerol-3-phosphate acyltransferase
MRKRDAYLWRLIFTGACFVLFGIGGLILGLLVIPAIFLLPGPVERGQARVRALVQRAFRLFVAIMNGGRGLSYQFVGRERLGRPGQLIIANHPTLIDVVLIVAFTPAPVCVVKEALFRNPFTRHVVRAAGYVSNAPTDRMLEEASAALEAGNTVVMFPEGTRTRPGQPMVFHRGAASVAIRSARVLTPVYIRCEPLVLPKTQPWYRVPAARPRWTVVVGEDIALQDFRGMLPPKASRLLNRFLVGHFEERLRGTAGYNGAQRGPGAATAPGLCEVGEGKAD